MSICHPLQDLWTAGVTELPQPGSLLGPTFTCIIGRQFHNLRFGDRFIGIISIVGIIGINGFIGFISFIGITGIIFKQFQNFGFRDMWVQGHMATQSSWGIS